MKAVIDRFEGKFAILILGEDEQRLNVPIDRLPQGSREGTWLQIELKNGELVSVVMDDEETVNVKSRIEEKLARLRRGDHLKK